MVHVGESYQSDTIICDLNQNNNTKSVIMSEACSLYLEIVSLCIFIHSCYPSPNSRTKTLLIVHTLEWFYSLLEKCAHEIHKFDSEALL